MRFPVIVLVSMQYRSTISIACASCGKVKMHSTLRLSTIIDEMSDVCSHEIALPPMHPGEMLREEFLVPLGLTAGRVAKAAGVPRTRIERIMREEIGITADTALRLSKILGTSPEFWTNLQSRYDLQTAKAALGSKLEDLPRLVEVA